MDTWTQLADAATLEKTIASLKANNIDAFFVENKEEAKKKLLELLPLGSEVFTMTSMTLEAIGVLSEINESGNYDSVRKKLLSMNRETQGREMRKLGASPDWAIGSVHAVTEDGIVMIASNTGSQLAAYAQGAGNIIWVVGAQKIVKNQEEGFRRIYEHCLPLESKRMSEKLGKPFTSSVSKILTVSKEVRPGRTTLIFVREVLGF